MRPLVDACSSWWTQGVSAALQPRLARVVGYVHAFGAPPLCRADARTRGRHAAGRWGHVMYPENAHAPALGLAARLLDGPGEGWARRTFFSDDGSTAVEVGLKMALRSYAANKVRNAARLMSCCACVLTPP
jgi:dethiobiotin synthetase/adenosylmethionine--8-amino-7-oxononanoate aminotransferase